MIKIELDFGEVDKEVEKAIRDIKLEAARELSKIGEMYIATSREKGNYQNRTGVLRNANSYRVYLDGKSISELVSENETSEMFDKMKSNSGLQLIVGNGMEYASFVEGKGFDVSTSGFLKVMEEVQKLIKIV